MSFANITKAKQAAKREEKRDDASLGEGLPFAEQISRAVLGRQGRDTIASSETWRLQLEVTLILTHTHIIYMDACTNYVSELIFYYPPHTPTQTLLRHFIFLFLSFSK
jgi:hypothetical protein